MKIYIEEEKLTVLRARICITYYSTGLDFKIGFGPEKLPSLPINELQMP